MMIRYYYTIAIFSLVFKKQTSQSEINNWRSIGPVLAVIVTIGTVDVCLG